MKYITYEKQNLTWQILYSPNGEDGESIIGNITDETYLKPFNVNEYEAEDKLIANDENMYVTTDIQGRLFIWQVGAKVSDMNGRIIPGCYKVRKIGILVN